MTVNVDQILDLLDPRRINRDVLQAHDWARETFNSPAMAVRDHREFKEIIESYVQHHFNSVGQGQLATERAFGEARRILENAFGKDRFQDGYAAALQMALDGANGGMREVLNEIAIALKRNALFDYTDDVFHRHIDALSRSHNLALSRAFYERFREAPRDARPPHREER